MNPKEIEKRLMLVKLLISNSAIMSLGRPIDERGDDVETFKRHCDLPVISVSDGDVEEDVIINFKNAYNNESCIREKLDLTTGYDNSLITIIGIFSAILDLNNRLRDETKYLEFSKSSLLEKTSTAQKHLENLILDEIKYFEGLLYKEVFSELTIDEETE
ncbi:hypothetical protein [uncultured Parasutterella sp.]|uniref:hypothetical protein n=1 Tax=uncultured Parasutterella sp. TaxID=1263098 RepID=UPI0025A546D2|nr:hypothetical protein [uncultured Parasutterella sp.]